MDVDTLIANDEAYRQFVYDDATGRVLRRGDTIVGHPTVGYGLCIESGVGAGMSPAVAMAALKEQRQAIENYLDIKYGAWFLSLDEVRRAALISAAYNLGLTHLNGFEKALDACAEKNWSEAAAQFRDSAWWRDAHTHPRAEQTARMIESGQWPEAT